MQILMVKTFLFLFGVLLSLFHDFWLGTKIIERLEQAPKPERSYPRAYPEN